MIGETLPTHALDRLISPILIIEAKRNPVAAAEIKLTQIAMQVLLGAVLVDAVPRLKIE